MVNRAQRTARLSVEISEALSNQISAVAEKKGMTKSAFVRQVVTKEVEISLEIQLTEAAETLASLYESDDELVVFTTLDGEDFA